MKKLSFEKLNFGNQDVLTRAEMKKVLGGYIGGSGSCHFSINCVFENGTGSGGSCSGMPDANGDCFPAEQECFNQANAWCNNTQGCYHCVPY